MVESLDLIYQIFPPELLAIETLNHDDHLGERFKASILLASPTPVLQTTIEIYFSSPAVYFTQVSQLGMQEIRTTEEIMGVSTKQQLGD